MDDDSTVRSAAFVCVMLGSVGFDGFSRTTLWQNTIANAQGNYVLSDPGKADLIGTGLNLLGLSAAILFVGLAYIGATKAAERTVESSSNLTRQFVYSLVPIALVYAVAHYFSLLVIQGQFVLPLASDPFGYGWSLFGSLGEIGAGHIAGLAIAHDRAVSLFRARDSALRSQYAMLALMVVYTVGGLWLLSQN